MVGSKRPFALPPASDRDGSPFFLARRQMVMKNAHGFSVVPAFCGPARREARPAGALGRAFGFRTFWRILALAVVIALAQVAVHALRSTASAGRSAGAAMAAGATAGGAAGATAASSGPFRDEDFCEIVGEPVECR
jgi:hypothetical protein